ncbi:MAG TPA: hypothetical protein VFV71_02580 [Burkholderiales bacterium]|nr:hypothetical protein [Burkholderiales bacterium]
MGDRSFERITKADLRKLGRIARAEREDFFERHPEWGMLYRKRVVCVALCGDAALHFVNGATGVDGFEVWTFYAGHPEAAFPFHQVSRADFGASKFGRDASGAYAGRRVELQGRSLDCRPGDDPIEVMQHYLRAGETPSARELRDRAVVLVEPDTVAGYVAWPTLALPGA